MIPSIRNPRVLQEYADNAREHDYDTSRLTFLVLTEDFVDKAEFESVLRREGLEGAVMNQQDRERLLRDLNRSEYVTIFPRRSHAETSFGIFYLFYRRKEFGTGFLIDDDTRPIKSLDFFGTHQNNLEFNGNLLELRSDKQWVNVLHYRYPIHRLYPRGYPYSAMHEKTLRNKADVSKVVLSQGLWTNVPDLDSVRILMDGDLNGQSKTRLSESDYGEGFTVAHRNYLTICSMNLAFRSEIAPAFYQYKMDDNQWGIGRFDDIWSGVVAKRVCDTLGYSIVTGNPLCQHDKAPRSTFKDLRSEVPGLEANEDFYKVVDQTETREGDVFEATRAIARGLLSSKHEFLRECGTDLSSWTDLLESVA